MSYKIVPKIVHLKIFAKNLKNILTSVLWSNSLAYLGYWTLFLVLLIACIDPRVGYGFLIGYALLLAANAIIGFLTQSFHVISRTGNNYNKFSWRPTAYFLEIILWTGFAFIGQAQFIFVWLVVKTIGHYRLKESEENKESRVIQEGESIAISLVGWILAIFASLFAAHYITNNSPEFVDVTRGVLSQFFGGSFGATK